MQEEKRRPPPVVSWEVGHDALNVATSGSLVCSGPTGEPPVATMQT
jgi:hypothetical protein